MRRRVRVHRANHAEVIRMSRRVREEIGNLQPALPARPKLERRLHQIPDRPPVRPDLRLPRVRGPMKLVEHRFWIERVHLRRRAIHEQKHAMLRRRRPKMRSLQSQRMQLARRLFDRRATLATSLLREEPIATQQINQRETSKPAASLPQKIAPSPTAGSHVGNEAMKHGKFLARHCGIPTKSWFES